MFLAVRISFATYGPKTSRRIRGRRGHVLLEPGVVVFLRVPERITLQAFYYLLSLIGLPFHLGQN